MMMMIVKILFKPTSPTELMEMGRIGILPEGRGKKEMVVGWVWKLPMSLLHNY
jgi:hypothetical protein